MKRMAKITLQFASKELSRIMHKTLLPEAKKSTTSRSKASLKFDGKKLTIYVEAEDTSAFRAALNSYLRWAALVKDTYEATVTLEKQHR